jgi:FKBP-type peptidyl-prolyl cis-trans isomerase FkpA
VKNSFLIVLAMLTIGLASCGKSNTTPFNPTQQAAIDDANIQAYIKAHNIDSVKKDPSGVYYKILTPGTGAYPTIKSSIIVEYQGALLNGTIFSPESSATGNLSEFIGGWQIGIPYINPGGTILLLIPSGYAYGDSSPGAAIPVNSVLVFNVTLVSFTN